MPYAAGSTGERMDRLGCWTDQPRPHPWHKAITDLACGYDDRMTYPGCYNCWRQRAESPLDQIPDGRGYRERNTGDRPA